MVRGTLEVLLVSAKDLEDVDFFVMSNHQFLHCVGNAWGEAALLLAAGSKGNRAALPLSTIMIKQVTLYSKHIGKTPEKIEEDIRHPKYFSPSEAVEYGIIDKVTVQ